MFNVLGNPIDELDPPTDVENWSIHRPAPAFEEQATSQEMLETGIKVVDLLCRTRRAVRLVCLAVQNKKDRADPGVDPQHCDRARRLFRIHRR